MTTRGPGFESATVGVVIPAFNAADYLPQLVEALRAERWQHWAGVVVNDGSTDATVSLLKELTQCEPRLRSLTIANAGPCVARNRGFAVLPRSVKYVTFMDADDRYTNHGLTRLKEALDQNPAAVGVHGLGEFIDHTGQRIDPGTFAALGQNRTVATRWGARRCAPDEPTTFASASTASVIFPPGLILARKTSYQKIDRGQGVFDPKLVKAEDWDVLLRLCRQGHLLALNDVVLEYRRHDSNLGASAGVGSACTRMLICAYQSPDNRPEHRRCLRRAWRTQQLGAIGSRARQFLNSAGLRPRIDAAVRAGLALIRLGIGRPTSWPLQQAR